MNSSKRQDSFQPGLASAQQGSAQSSMWPGSPPAAAGPAPHQPEHKERGSPTAPRPSRAEAGTPFAGQFFVQDLSSPHSSPAGPQPGPLFPFDSRETEAGVITRPVSEPRAALRAPGPFATIPTLTDSLGKGRSGRWSGWSRASGGREPCSVVPGCSEPPRGGGMQPREGLLCSKETLGVGFECRHGRQPTE